MTQYFIIGLGISLGIFLSALFRGGFKRKPKSWLREISVRVGMFFLVAVTWPAWVAIYAWELALITKKQWFR